MTPTDLLEFQRCNCKSRLRAVVFAYSEYPGFGRFEACTHQSDFRQQVAKFLAGFVGANFVRGPAPARLQLLSSTQITAHGEQLARLAVDPLQSVFRGVRHIVRDCEQILVHSSERERWRRQHRDQKEFAQESQ